jgi:predicted transport protein
MLHEDHVKQASAKLFKEKEPFSSMPLFALKNDKLERVKEIPFKSERKDIQKVTESSLKEVFGYEFIKSEVTLGNLRIDTLAFDSENKSFVIIEYKIDQSFSVIDQGYAYLGLLLNSKADFILEYNESKDASLKRNDVDWSQSKVIFVSPQFTKYQKQAINFRDLPIELWEISKFANGTLLFNQLKSPETSESITKISQRSEIVQKVSREIRVYTEEDHLNGLPNETIELYQALKERLLSLGDNIRVRPTKLYVGFVADSNFVDIHPQKTKLKLWINLPRGALDDPEKITRDVSEVGHWGNGDYEVTIESSEPLDYLITLIKQSYTKHS